MEDLRTREGKAATTRKPRHPSLRLLGIRILLLGWVGWLARNQGVAQHSRSAPDFRLCTDFNRRSHGGEATLQMLSIPDTDENPQLTGSNPDQEGEGGTKQGVATGPRCAPPGAGCKDRPNHPK